MTALIGRARRPRGGPSLLMLPGAPLATLVRSRLRGRDLAGVAVMGLRTRRLRSGLTALGVAIGIAALVAVMGISASNRADLLAELEALGTNRLQVSPGQSMLGESATLPTATVPKLRRIPAVEQVSAVTGVSATVRRNDLISEAETGGIAVRASDLELPATIGATVAEGRWLDAASEQLPTVVLGARAAERLGINDVGGGRAVYLSGEWFTVIGILDPVPLYPNLDNSAFIGYSIAEELFDATRSPSTVYVVSDPEVVDEVRAILAPTTNPESPNEVNVTNPSDALKAQTAVDESLNRLLLGLGAVALVVGGIGIANVMVIGVIERRSEIGVRRALGATRRHIRLQFLLEAAVLGLAGGILGVGAGAAVTVGVSRVQDTVVSLPPNAIALGLGAALVVGALAGLSPAARAARLAPADAVRPA